MVVASEEAMVRIRSPRKKKREQPEKVDEEDAVFSRTPSTDQQNFASDCRKVNWMYALNAGPTTAVMLAVFVFFSTVSMFLDRFIVTAEQSVVVFLIGSYIVFTSYFTFHYYLENFSESYKNVETDKQFYVLSNMIKSATLLSYTPLAAHLLYSTMVLDVWDTVRIRNLGVMYCIPDFVSLFLVKKMSITTIVHHLAVCLFTVVNVLNDYEQDNVCRLMLVYGVFSTFAYLVNLLLASRFLGISPWLAQIMSGFALLIYAACCGMNWAWQVVSIHKLLWNGHTYPVYMFVLVISMVVYDDLVLMKWLWYKTRTSPKSVADSKKKKAEAAKEK